MPPRALLLGALTIQAYASANFLGQYPQPMACNCGMYQPAYQPVMWQPVMYQPVPQQMYQPPPQMYQPPQQMYQPPQQMYQPPQQMYQPGQQMYQPLAQPVYQPVYQRRAASFEQHVQAPGLAPAPSPMPAMAPVPGGPAPVAMPPPSGAQPVAPQPAGPTPECPCLTTAAPTEEPGSPDASEEMVEAAAENAAKDGQAEILEAGQKETAAQKAKVQKAGSAGSKALATKELEAVRKKRLGPHMDRLQAEQDNKDKIEKDMADKARDAALEHTAEITEAAAELSTIKSQNVINKVLDGAGDEAKAAEERAIELANEADQVNAVALASSNKALASAYEAQSAAMKYPHDTALAATQTAQEAEQKALYLQDQQATAQRMAESAAMAAKEAKEMAASAFVTATTSKETAEKALTTATKNGEKLIKLNIRAQTAMNAADGAAHATKMAEETVVAARAAREAALAVTTAPPQLL